MSFIKLSIYYFCCRQFVLSSIPRYLRRNAAEIGLSNLVWNKFDSPFWMAGYTRGYPEIPSNLNYFTILCYADERPEQGPSNWGCIWNFRYTETTATRQQEVKLFLLAFTDLNKISSFSKKKEEDKQMGMN